MFLDLLLIMFQLISLWILSQRLTQRLYHGVHTIVRFRTIAVGIISIMLFPGTLIHELSHMIVAIILGVHTGNLRVIPHGIAQKDVSFGSVEIEKTDSIRRMIIGIAPLFIGISVLLAFSSMIPAYWDETLLSYANGYLFSTPPVYITLMLGYGIFAISNSMFTSKSDMKGVLPTIAFISVLIGISYYVGFRLQLTEGLQAYIGTAFRSIIRTLTVVLCLNLGLFVSASLPIWLRKKSRQV